MNRNNYTRADLSSGLPVFLLDVTWGGITYYLANIDIQVPDGSGGNIDYVGAIQDFNYIESMDLSGEEIESNVLSCAVIFDQNPIEQFSLGNPLEGSEAVFSYVILKNGVVTIDHDDRVILMRGIVQEPQYGDPLEPDGFVSMSIELDQLDSETPIIDQRLRIDSRFTGRHVDTANGKPWPIVFGLPNDFSSSSFSTYSTPAYVIKQGTGTSDSTRWMIAGQEIKASQVKIQDDKFDSLTLPVALAVDNNGNPYSYISYQMPLGYSGLALPLTGGWASGTTRSYFVAFNATDGGAMLNPFGSGILEGGGDICRWALSKTNQKIDYGAWAGLAPLLNKFKFAGYINDPDISAWQWLAGNILPWLPISIRTGPNGLTPVLNQLHALTYLDPVISIDIDSNAEFQRLGAVETTRTTADLVNQYSFSFAKLGYSQGYTKQVRVTEKAVKNYDIRSDYSTRSINLYGVKDGSGESDYVYDTDTATMIALGQIARLSMPIRTLDISAPFNYGYIKIGDIISLTSGALFMKNLNSMVTQKEWLGSYWRFQLTFELNSIKS